MAGAARPDIVHEGWLTKSPPSKRIWKLKWRRRWFTLRQSKDVPTKFFLDYYADKNGQKLKGSINLDLCEQIDAGLRMQSTSKGSVFSIRTQSRTYHLQADCVTDMEKWVEVICRACGLYSTDQVKFFIKGPEKTFRTDSSLDPKLTPRHESAPSLYIPLSECVTGLPSSKEKNGMPLYMNCNSMIVRNSIYNADSVTNATCKEPSQILKNVKDENRNGLSEEFCQVLTISGSHVPPRPPKPSHLVVEATPKESFIGPRLNEPQEVENYNRYAPTIDRNLKPRHLYGSFNCYENMKKLHINENIRVLNLDLVTSSSSSGSLKRPKENTKKLQYLDLDLVPPSADSESKYMARLEASSSTNYKTVDFLKTEALIMTRAEACRRTAVSYH